MVGALSHAVQWATTPEDGINMNQGVCVPRSTSLLSVLTLDFLSQGGRRPTGSSTHQVSPREADEQHSYSKTTEGRIWYRDEVSAWSFQALCQTLTCFEARRLSSEGERISDSLAVAWRRKIWAIKTKFNSSWDKWIRILHGDREFVQFNNV